MKKLFLLVTSLLGLCTLGANAAKADLYYEDNRGGEYRRPVYRETYRDDCDYGPRRRVVIVREYERPYRYEDDYRPRYHHRRTHVSFFLPVPPPY